MKTVVFISRSAAYRKILRSFVDGDPGILVAGEADGAENAVRVVITQRPGVAVVDLSMGSEDVNVIEALGRNAPVPILALCPANDPVGAEALRRGAIDLMPRPVAGEAGGAAALRERIKLVATVPLIRRAQPIEPTARAVTSAAPPRAAQPALRLVVLAASAGGASAVARILELLGNDFPACVAVVQHLPVGFAATYAAFLRQSCSFEVALVGGRTPIRAATVLLPADDRHLVAATGEALDVSSEPALGGHRPSATVLFRSVARAFGPEAVGVVLSGIGDDGASGLAEMRARGAITIAQDEETAAVFGMPRAAIAAGAASEVLAVDAIGAYLLAAARTEDQP